MKLPLLTIFLLVECLLDLDAMICLLLDLFFKQVARFYNVDPEGFSQLLAVLLLLAAWCANDDKSFHYRVIMSSAISLTTWILKSFD